MMTLQPQPSGITTAPRSWPERIASYVVMVLWICAGLQLSKMATTSGWKYPLGIALILLLIPLARWVEKRVLIVVRARLS